MTETFVTTCFIITLIALGICILQAATILVMVKLINALKEQAEIHKNWRELAKQIYKRDTGKELLE